MCLLPHHIPGQQDWPWGDPTPLTEVAPVTHACASSIRNPFSEAFQSSLEFYHLYKMFMLLFCCFFFSFSMEAIQREERWSGAEVSSLAMKFLSSQASHVTLDKSLRASLYCKLTISGRSVLSNTAQIYLAYLLNGKLCRCTCMAL